jgi:hypothetical protein
MLTLVLALVGIVLFSGCTEKSDPCDDSGISSVVSQATREKNPGLCDQIKIQSCKDTCLNHASVNKGDATACPQIQNQKSMDNCYAMVAINTKNKALCDKVTDNTLKQTCLKGGL